MKRTAAILVLLASTAVAPARAEPTVSGGAYADRLQLFEVYQSEGATTEVWMFGGAGEVLVNTAGSGGEEFEAGGCLTVTEPLDDGTYLIDEACGAFTVEPSPLLETTEVAGSLEGSGYLYHNDPELGPTFEYLGPSTIDIDLKLVATSDPRLAEPERMGLMFCGLPPDMRGGGVLLHAPYVRDVKPVGTIDGSYTDPVDGATLFGMAYESTYAETGACVEGV